MTLSKVFKIAHKATSTAIAKGSFKSKSYRQVFASKLKWAWKTVKSAANEVTELTFESINSLPGFQGIAKETAKAVLIHWERRDYSIAELWMPKSAFGANWGMKMLDNKLNELGL